MKSAIRVPKGYALRHGWLVRVAPPPPVVIGGVIGFVAGILTDHRLIGILTGALLGFVIGRIWDSRLGRRVRRRSTQRSR